MSQMIYNNPTQHDDMQFQFRVKKTHDYPLCQSKKADWKLRSAVIS